MTQSAGFQFAEIAWKSWKGPATWFYFFRGKESSPSLLGGSSSLGVWCEPRAAGILGLSWEGKTWKWATANALRCGKAGALYSCMGTVQGCGCGCPPLPGLACPPGPGAPGCTLCFVFPAATWEVSLKEAAFISSPGKILLVWDRKQLLLEPTSPAWSLRRRLFLPYLQLL